MYHVIRLFLGSTSFSFPHVVDVKWRLDNHLKEDNFEKINDPVFLIDLKVEVSRSILKIFSFFIIKFKI